MRDRGAARTSGASNRTRGPRVRRVSSRHRAAMNRTDELARQLQGRWHATTRLVAILTAPSNNEIPIAHDVTQLRDVDCRTYTGN